MIILHVIDRAAFRCLLCFVVVFCSICAQARDLTKTSTTDTHRLMIQDEDTIEKLATFSSSSSSSSSISSISSSGGRRGGSGDFVSPLEEPPAERSLFFFDFLCDIFGLFCSCEKSESGLRDAIEDSDNGDTISLCKASTIELDDEITIPTGRRLSVKCLRTFFYSGKCTISGGSSTRLFKGNNVDVSFERIDFREGSANGDGGCIMLENQSELDITDSSFTACEAVGGSGGAIYADSSSVDIDDVEFSGNLVEGFGDGGAIALIGTASSLSASDCDFEFNRAPGDGGAISVKLTGSTVTDSEVKDCYFRTNNAGRYGGAITVGNGVLLKVDDSTFDANSASDAGGAIGVVDADQDASTAPELICDTCTVKNNQALAQVTSPGTGGGGGIVGTANAIIRLNDSLLGGNFAVEGPGDILFLLEDPNNPPASENVICDSRTDFCQSFTDAIDYAFFPDLSLTNCDEVADDSDDDCSSL